jgi:hypothetical protein
MSAPLVHPEDVIRRAPVGSCIYSLTRLDTSPEEVDFLIREETARIEAWENPPIELRSANMDQGGVILVPILARVGEDLYECWVNHYAEEVRFRRVLGTLAIQERLVLHFYGDQGELVRSLRVSNPHRDFFAEAARRCEATAPWTMQEFDTAREAIYRWHPSVSDLWRALRPKRKA